MDIRINSVSFRIFRSEITDLLWTISKKINSIGIKMGDRNKPSVLFLYYPNAIAESQLYPFFLNRKEITAKYNLDFYMRSVDTVKEVINEDIYNPRIILIQVHFHSTKKFIDSLFLALKNKWPAAKIILMDWYATSDLRLLDNLDSYIDQYVKKTLFVESQNYEHDYFGDTNLMDYYGKIYNCDHKTKRYLVPASIDKKLTNGVGFLTAPYLRSLFSHCLQPNETRFIDLNARFSTSGSQWYSSMRNSALAVASDLPAKYKVATGPLKKRIYLDELSHCKTTLSPFGYGEICWRDYEAIAMGSLLFKPNMGHLTTNPDIFCPYETYIPIAWDFSDFKDKFIYYLERPKEIERIASNAYQVCHQYLKNGLFLNHVDNLFADQNENGTI